MATGPFAWIDRALLRFGDALFDLDGVEIRAVLLNDTQAVTRAFTGSSGEARYADLTGELATANGYTAGGLALTGKALSRAAASGLGANKWTSDPWTWTVTGSGLTFKYCALVAWGLTNKDLLMVCDMDAGVASSLTVTAGPLVFTPSSDGLGSWGQA